MKWKNNKGFSLAELLVVVAIIVILMGVAFVAVQNHQRSMTRLEFDGIAKEIFIAAQNHLTSAEGQGYLQFTAKPEGDTAEIEAEQKETERIGIKEDSSSGTEDVRYFIYNAVHTYARNNEPPKSILDLMLPFGSVDDTVRLGGTYIIRYQPSSGTVLDVFYSFPGKSSMLTISGKTLDSTDYPTLMGDETNYREGGERNRERYPDGVVGWYGSVEPLPIGERLIEPEIVIHNEEALWVSITDNNLGSGSLKLTVIGATSGAKRAFDLRKPDADRDNRIKSTTNVVLDDITEANMHFANLTADEGNFIRGENLIIEAIAFDNTRLTNIARSGRKTTNSLFADIEMRSNKDETDETIIVTEPVALVEYFRHLENLDETVSAFDGMIQREEGDPDAIRVTKVEQVKNLIWTGTEDKTTGVRPFIENIKSFNNIEEDSPVEIFPANSSTAIATGSTLYPVSPNYQLSYDGLNKSITGVTVNQTDSAGLFGALDKEGDKVENLELIDFDITATSGNAGALVGTTNGTEITNVVAHNSEDNDTKFDNDDTTTGKKPNVTATGAAGGLIGSMSGGSVTKSAAAVYVKGGTAAGGLIGSVTGNNNTVTACYSGGHTYSGAPAYDSTADRPDARNSKNTYPVRYYDADNNPMYNVTTTGGTAGGLIGSAGTATISNSYSTCSASGTEAGGFVGSSTGSISDCYCTGLVMKPGDSVTNHGAFAGSAIMGNLSNCQFFEIINEIKKDESDKEINGYEYLRPLGNVSREDTDEGKVFALDSVAAMSNEKAAYNYNLARTELKNAVPYDPGLTTYFENKYLLKTVEQLGATLEKDSDGKVTDFIATHYGDWPAPEEFIFT